MKNDNRYSCSEVPLPFLLLLLSLWSTSLTGSLIDWATALVKCALPYPDFYAPYAGTGIDGRMLRRFLECVDPTLNGNLAFKPLGAMMIRNCYSGEASTFSLLY